VSGESLADASAGISAGHASGILVKILENRSEEEIQTLKRLETIHWITERCCPLFEQFAGTLRDKEQRSKEHSRRQLEEWTGQAKASWIAESEAFAVKAVSGYRGGGSRDDSTLQPGRQPSSLRALSASIVSLSGPK
jgi:hypothetical protein